MGVRLQIISVLAIMHASFVQLPSGKNITFTKDCGRSNVAKDRRFGITEAEGRRFGITEAEVGAWPWMAALFIDNQGLKSPECGGALISSRHVVTSSSCVSDLDGSLLPVEDLTVRLGDHDLFSSEDKTEPVDIEVIQIINHPEFKKINFRNNIAILVLKEEIRFNRFVQPICLTDEQAVHTDYEGRIAFVTGWGAKTFNGPASNKLKLIRMPIWSQFSCQEAYRKVIALNEDYMCAGFNEADACRGDEGSPLMLREGADQRYYLLGLVSFGKRCGLPEYPGVYTNVRSYVPWIKEVILHSATNGNALPQPRKVDKEDNKSP